MLLQDSEHFSRQKEKLSSWILDYDKNAYCDSRISENSRELLIDSFNECSDLRKSFHHSLNQFFTNLGFSSMNNIRKYEQSFTYYDNNKYDKHNNSFGNGFGFSFNRYSSMPKIDRERGGIINLKKKLRDNNKSKNKNKKKNKNKYAISLKKKLLMNEIENSKVSDYEEDEEEKVNEYENKNIIKDDADNNKEIDEKINKEKERDYLLDSIYNQFGITKSQLLNIEEEKDNIILKKEEGKNNKYIKKNLNKDNPIKKSNLEIKEIKKKNIISPINTDKKEKIKEKITKKIIQKENDKLFENEKEITQKKK